MNLDMLHGGSPYNGAIVLAPGTAANPAIQLGGPSVGLYSTGSGNLSVSFNGVQAAVFGSSGAATFTTATIGTLTVGAGGMTVGAGGIGSTGLVVVTNQVNVAQLVVTAPAVPANAAAAGTAGTIAWDTGFVYVCTAANTWKRVAIATW